MAIKKLSASYAATILNGLIPLTVIPAISRDSGLEVLGQVFVAIALVGVGQLLIDYGFNFSAMRKHSEAKAALPVAQASGKVLLEVTFCKLVLFVPLLVVLHLLRYFDLPDHVTGLENWIISGALISLVNFSWLFFSIEKSLSYSLCMLITRGLFCLPIFFLSLTAEKVTILLVIPQVLTNIIILLANYSSVTIRFHLSFTKLDVRSQYVSGITIYLTTIISSLSTFGWPLMMAFFVDQREIGAYIIADRIFRGMMSFATPLPNFIIAASAAGSSAIFTKMISDKRLILGLGAIIFLQIGVTFVPDGLIRHALGNDLSGFEDMLRIYSFCFWFGMVNLTFYTWAIIEKVEYVFTISYLAAAAFAALAGVWFGIALYIPLISEGTLALLCIGNALRRRSAR